MISAVTTRFASSRLIVLKLLKTVSPMRKFKTALISIMEAIGLGPKLIISIKRLITTQYHGFAWRPTELLMACNQEQKEKYLDPCVTGEKVECFAITEPGAGSDIMSMATRATQDGEDWVINGAKHFVSGHIEPDFAILFAATGVDQTERGPRKRVSAFLVDKGHPGFDITRGPRCVSQRAYLNFVLSFNDCRVSQSQMLGAEGKHPPAVGLPSPSS